MGIVAGRRTFYWERRSTTLLNVSHEVGASWWEGCYFFRDSALRQDSSLMVAVIGGPVPRQVVERSTVPRGSHVPNPAPDLGWNPASS